MEYLFKPCVSRSACTEDGTHCRACGRSHEEINAIRDLINQITQFSIDMKYENYEDFLLYLNSKVSKKIKSRLLSS